MSRVAHCQPFPAPRAVEVHLHFWAVAGAVPRLGSEQWR